MIVLLGDFNAKCTSWYKDDKTNFEEMATEKVMVEPASSIIFSYLTKF